MNLDALLEKYNVSYDELRPDERDSLTTMLADVQQTALTVEKIREHLAICKFAVEQELANTPSNLFVWFFGWKKDYGLKARLRNYMLLESIFTAHDKARKTIEQSLSQVKK